MNRHKIILAVALMLAAAVVPTTAQSTTYTYVGPQFTYFNGYTCPSTCNISGFFTMSSPLPTINSRSGWKLLSGCSYKDGVLTARKSKTDCAAGIFLIQRPNCENYEGFHGSGEKVPTVCKLLRT
jgi:hypothetical protein